jgi:hypothetical protein
MKSRVITSLVIATATLAASSAVARATKINFDNLPPNEVITNQFAGQGVTFQGGQTVSEGVYLYPVFDEGSEPSALSNYDNTPGDALEGIIQANPNSGEVFTDVGAYVSNLNAVTLSAFDANNDLLGSVSVPQFDPQNPGEDNPTLPQNYLTLSFPDISYVQLTGPENQAFSFIMDGFSFDEAPAGEVASPISSPVPEPASMGLFLAAGAITLRHRRRANRPS